MTDAVVANAAHHSPSGRRTRRAWLAFLVTAVLAGTGAVIMWVAIRSSAPAPLTVHAVLGGGTSDAAAGEGAALRLPSYVDAIAAAPDATVWVAASEQHDDTSQLFSVRPDGSARRFHVPGPYVTSLAVAPQALGGLRRPPHLPLRRRPARAGVRRAGHPHDHGRRRGR